VDKGGRKNVFGKMFGSPRELLAREGLSLFDLFSEKKGTGYDGGPFHQFLNDVFEYATGRDPEVLGKLIAAIKSAVEERKVQDAQRQRAKDIRKKIERLRRSLSNNPSLATEIDDLQDRLDGDCGALGRIRLIFEQRTVLED
jgi:hypothetical protein